MTCTKNYKDFVLEQLSLLDEITCKSMMGGYLLYYKGTLFGGIYSDRLLVKITSLNEKYNMPKVEPYKNAKLMYLVDDMNNKGKIKEIVLDTYDGLLK